VNVSEHGPVHYRYETAYGYRHVTAILMTFYVIKETRCGYWVVPSWQFPVSDPSSVVVKRHRKWIRKDSRKRHCYPSKEEAWNSYMLRCSWRVEHLERQLKYARLAEQLRKPDDKVPTPTVSAFDFG